MMRNIFEWIDLQPEERVLEVGSGTGVICRWLARETKRGNPITGLDLNGYLLGEAAALTRSDGLDNIINYQAGDAEALHFDDNAFDVAFSTTVMEEVNAKRMLSEMIRVVRPGGRIGVIVRATDTSYRINLPVSDTLRLGFENQQTLNEGESCASASLYRLFQRSSLTNVQFSPQLATFYEPFGVVEQFLMAGYLSSLSDEDQAVWKAALTEAQRERDFFITWPHHAATGCVQ